MAKVEALPWVKTQTEVDLAGKATITLGKDLEYVGPPGSNQFIEMNGNPPPPVETYIVSRKDFRWFSAYSFDPSGYVRDDEDIDPDKFLAQLQESNKANLARRQELGLPALTLVGWYVPPHYDKNTHQLEWGTKFTDSSNNTVVNYTVRVLGRGGVMSATLVSDPANMDADVKEFRASLSTIKFNAGESYSEFRAGDKVAAYGLGALVVGGAAAVAAKSAGPFLKIVGLALLAAGAAAINFVRNLFSRRPKA